MKIKLGTFVIADHGEESPGNLSFPSQEVVQMVGRMRQANMTPIHRGNQSTTVSFNTTKQFDTITKAELYMLDLRDVVPKTGTLEIQVDREKGSRFYEGAVFVSASPRQMGCSLTIDWQIAVGATRKTKTKT